MKNSIATLSLAGLAFLIMKPSIASEVCAPGDSQCEEIELSDDQITGGFPFNEVWTSPGIDVDPTDEGLLSPGEMFTYRLLFEDHQHLELQDELFSSEESIHIDIDGAAGPGGGGGTFDWEVTLLHVEGDLVPIRPVFSGSDMFSGLTGSANVDEDLQITDDSLFFHGIDLKITNTSGLIWAFNRVSVGVDADDIEIGDWEKNGAPEPLTIIASGLAVGLGALCQREYSKKRRKK